jgi:7-carboxy-7-deazaguanine synthase
LIKLVDLFWTLQGEGFHAGRRALFLRLPFCNLQCPWCDTEFNKFTEWNEEVVEQFALGEKSRFAVITGGEPSKSAELPKVIEILKAHKFEIAIESNGHFPIDSRIDFVTISPKRFHKTPYFICNDAFERADEFKYVVDEGFDWRVLERHNDEIDFPKGRHYSLSPEFNRFEKSVEEIINYIKEHPQWKLSLQTHKIIKMP